MWFEVYRNRYGEILKVDLKCLWCFFRLNLQKYCWGFFCTHFFKAFAPYDEWNVGNTVFRAPCFWLLSAFFPSLYYFGPLFKGFCSSVAGFHEFSLLFYWENHIAELDQKKRWLKLTLTFEEPTHNIGLRVFSSLIPNLRYINIGIFYLG